MMGSSLKKERLRLAFPNLPEDATFHSLRSIYLQLVDLMYVHNKAPTLLGELVLGHGSEKEAISYNAVRVEGTDGLRNCLGPLDLTLPSPAMAAPLT